jgi:hypothetical protein
MRTHSDIDRRSLDLARAVVATIDADPARQGLIHARATCDRWRREINDTPAIREWADILAGPWERVRSVLLDESEEGRRLRQNSPFAGVLAPRVRWDIYRRHRCDPHAT